MTSDRDLNQLYDFDLFLLPVDLRLKASSVVDSTRDSFESFLDLGADPFFFSRAFFAFTVLL